VFVFGFSRLQAHISIFFVNNLHFGSKQQTVAGLGRWATVFAHFAVTKLTVTAWVPSQVVSGNLSRLSSDVLQD